MTNTMMGSLREVQKLDERIREIGRALTVFDEKIAEVEEPALALESELSQLMGRLTQMRTDARSLERSAEDKRARADKMDQRLNRVSNLREEAAVQTELDLIRRAIEGDEQEALQMLEQIHRSETAAEALEAAATSARAEVGPQREVLLGEREAYSVRMETFTTRREDILQHVGDAERKVYDSFHQSGRPVIVSALLDDGACGNCFGLIQLQLQNEIRRNERLIRCENCGVILTVEPEPVLEGDVLIPTAWMPPSWWIPSL
jgi:predicted  nucleic acid-binding Zn-ribbon protein